ncbi:MAG: 16S rRNA (guanine(527)-N(7))-methyltransferase RsmG [Candidatus Moranbacteria bacterium]|nr:16S rRNA (guanine(527)-N(7))-methyltransferase RsmG [Candidatus Moranbacteria bacterium]
MKNKLRLGAEILGIGELSDELIDRLLLFAEELLRWNARINLTSITKFEEVVEKHLLDSLVLVSVLKGSSRILDVGSGAGIPVIPLALALPNQQFYSVDSVEKKINFQKHIRRQLDVKNLAIECSRIEDLKQTRHDWKDFNVVLARAVSHTNNLLEMALPVIAPGGLLVAMKGSEGAAELAAIESRWRNYYDFSEDIREYRLPFSGAERCLIRISRKKSGA